MTLKRTMTGTRADLIAAFRAERDQAAREADEDLGAADRNAPERRAHSSAYLEALDWALALVQDWQQTAGGEDGAAEGDTLELTTETAFGARVIQAVTALRANRNFVLWIARGGIRVAAIIDAADVHEPGDCCCDNCPYEGDHREKSRSAAE